MWNPIDEVKGIETPPHAKLSLSEIMVKHRGEEEVVVGPRGPRRDDKFPLAAQKVDPHIVKVATLAFCVGILFLSALVIISFQSDQFGPMAVFGGLSVFVLAAFIFWTELGSDQI